MVALTPRLKIALLWGWFWPWWAKLAGVKKTGYKDASLKLGVFVRSLGEKQDKWVTIGQNAMAASSSLPYRCRH